MSSELGRLEWLECFEHQGHFAGRRIELTDPDQPTYRQIYEDLGEINRRQRRCLVTLYPEHARAASLGQELNSLVEMDHEAALRDIRRMMQQGYRITEITRDIH